MSVTVRDHEKEEALLNLDHEEGKLLRSGVQHWERGGCAQRSRCISIHQSATITVSSSYCGRPSPQTTLGSDEFTSSRAGGAGTVQCVFLRQPSRFVLLESTLLRSLLCTLFSSPSFRLRHIEQTAWCSLAFSHSLTSIPRPLIRAPFDRAFNSFFPSI